LEISKMPAAKKKNTKETQQNSGVKVNPVNSAYGKQRIPGPRNLLGNEVKPKKPSHNQEYHDSISEAHGENVVHTQDQEVFINGLIYGPGLVDCGDATLPVGDPGSDNVKQVKIADMVRAAVDRNYVHAPEEEDPEILRPKSPTGAVDSGSEAPQNNNFGAESTSENEENSEEDNDTEDEETEEE
jgi:hypothetical protein